MEELKIGDKVFIEQAWEDEAGHYHDEHATISRILPNGELRFRIGYWKNRNAKDEKIQAWLNQQELYSKDVQKV